MSVLIPRQGSALLKPTQGYQAPPVGILAAKVKSEAAAIANQSAAKRSEPLLPPHLGKNINIQG